MSDTNRKDELLALTLAARRGRDAKAPLAPVNPDQRSSVPTPEDDRQSDFIKKMTPEQRALYSQLLDSFD